MKDWSAIYDVLVKHAGADERDGWQFVACHEIPPGCTEFRFCGKLGFGGKYRSQRNTVDCYREDETPERLAIIAATNAALAQLEKKS